MRALSRFFIDRPTLAWVLAVVIMLAGGLAITRLPVAQYPGVAPPAIAVSASYPGADATSLETSVTQVIEQQLKGLDRLLYFSSVSQPGNGVTITASFAPGADPDIAQVQVQNKVQQALPLLPPQVQAQGVSVYKSQTTYLMVIAIYDDTGRYSNIDVADYVNSRMQDPVSRVEGVGGVVVYGGQYAMRIWLDPFKLNSYGLTVGDVRAAILAQNVQVSAGQLGAVPSVPGQQLNATISVQSRLQSADQFRDIVVRAARDGSVIRLGDIARVELGADSYDIVARYNGYPAAGLAIKLAPGANALRTVAAIKAKVRELQPNLPVGLKVAYPVDNTTFVKLSIRDVVVTLFEAILLVIGVMYLVLQSWRATVIPAIAVPVVLLGTFAVLLTAGYSINTLTLFALVLAIGFLVDDAIIVVENVERLMAQEGLSPRDATLKSMDEITGALIGVALVLAAVFLPMGFFGGSTGVIYRQFSVTMVSAMGLSALVALVLTPALCVSLLKAGGGIDGARRFAAVNRGYAALAAGYDRLLPWLMRRPRSMGIAYVVLLVLLTVLVLRLPTGFLPDEDQGSMVVQFSLPTGAVQARTARVANAIEHHLFVDEGARVDGGFTVLGFSFGGTGQNQGTSFIHLRDWSARPGARNRASAIARQTTAALGRIRDARVFAFIPPPVQELGNASGFDLELEDQGGLGHAALLAARNQLLAMASRDPKLTAVRPNGQDDAPQLQVKVDLARAGALGLSAADINDTLSAAWGSAYVNQFVDRGRIKRVYIQGEAPYRMSPEDLGRWYVRTGDGAMAPVSAFADTTWTSGPARLERYNGVPSMEILGQAAPGLSSGAAMHEMERLAARLPPGIGYDWTGVSFQERASGAYAPALYGLSVLVVFLCLVGLYESWSIPFAVVLVIPLGIVGAVGAVTLRGLSNDIYFHVAVLATMGLTAKNAILIVEFAAAAERRGLSAAAAAAEGAGQRLRPILMTSTALIAGVSPLALASGPGAGSQNDIGTGVIGGMLSGTLLTIGFAPLLYTIVRRVFGAAPRRAARKLRAIGGAS